MKFRFSSQVATSRNDDFVWVRATASAENFPENFILIKIWLLWYFLLPQGNIWYEITIFPLLPLVLARPRATRSPIILLVTYSIYLFVYIHTTDPPDSFWVYPRGMFGIIDQLFTLKKSTHQFTDVSFVIVIFRITSFDEATHIVQI